MIASGRTLAGEKGADSVTEPYGAAMRGIKTGGVLLQRRKPSFDSHCGIKSV